MVGKRYVHNADSINSNLEKVNYVYLVPIFLSPSAFFIFKMIRDKLEKVLIIKC